MRDKSGWMKGALAAALLVLLPALARAQATGTISGVVTDPSGAILPGATIEAKSAATGQVRTATTGPEGFYTVPLVSPGRYEVKASLSGFQSATRTNVQVSVSETARANLTPAGRIGRRRTSRSSAESPLVETANATLGHRDRREEGRRPAAQRPQLHPARDADPRRRGPARHPRRRRR